MITRLAVTLSIKAPYATRAGQIGGFGVDLPLARDGQGRLMLAGTHVIGKLAEAMRELVALLAETGETAARKDFEDDLKVLFATSAQGVGAEDATGREGRRQITASDFICDDPGPARAATRTRIARDTATGTVAEGMYQVIEAPAAAGEPLRFDGHLRFFGALDTERRGRIEKALRFIPQVGGLRTIGFGEVAAVSVADAPALPARAVPPPADRLLLRLRFEDPFCAGEYRNTANTYVSAKHVPGGVIKGAIARQLLAASGLTGYLDEALKVGKLSGNLEALARAFGELRISHALPAPRGHCVRKPNALPESLVRVLDDNSQPLIFDLVGLPDPAKVFLINDQVPIALFDWKSGDRQAARSLFGLPELPRSELRIRTQIDPDRRAAMAGRLFGVEYTQTHHHDFLAHLDLPLNTSKDEESRILAGLEEVLAKGLAGIGRGGAFAAATLETTEPAPEIDDRETRVVLVLQSAALLRTRGQESDLTTVYAAAFRQLGLPAGWRLKTVFVRERLAGGGFFLQRRASKPYSPWLLTEPGSTFVFDRTSGSAGFPSVWLRGGLDVPGDVLGYYGLSGAQTYREVPYLPQNGYGEVIAGFPLASGARSFEALRPECHRLEVVDDLARNIAVPR